MSCCEFSRTTPVLIRRAREAGSTRGDDNVRPRHVLLSMQLSCHTKVMSCNRNPALWPVCYSAVISAFKWEDNKRISYGNFHCALDLLPPPFLGAQTSSTSFQQRADKEMLSQCEGGCDLPSGLWGAAWKYFQHCPASPSSESQVRLQQTSTWRVLCGFNLAGGERRLAVDDLVSPQYYKKKKNKRCLRSAAFPTCAAHHHSRSTTLHVFWWDCRHKKEVVNLRGSQSRKPPFSVDNVTLKTRWSGADPTQSSYWGSEQYQVGYFTGQITS